MNILPKKRWHVRTKENIARVRKDEAEAAEKEKKEQQRIENADREARLNLLRQKSKLHLEKNDSYIVTNIEDKNEFKEHINLFTDLEHSVQTTNKEHDREVKKKTEEYEKKIGYLTYLGQDTNEAEGKKNWYELPPGSSRSANVRQTYDKLVLKDDDGNPRTIQPDIKDGEVQYKSKYRNDPMRLYEKYCSKVKSSSKKEKKHKKNKHKDSEKHKSSSSNIEKLRAARLKREQQERSRTEAYLSSLNKPKEPEKSNVPLFKAKYNSQFNPDLARQNFR